MKLFGMFRTFKACLETGGREEPFTPDQMVAQLVDAEWDERQNRGIDLKIRNARFRYKAA